MVQVGRIKKNILIFGKYYRCTSASKHKTFFFGILNFVENYKERERFEF